MMDPRAAVRPLRIGYVVGTYPLLTTTFIEREIDALRAVGHRIEVLSLRRPPAGERRDLASAADRPVHYLLPARPRHVIATHLRHLARQPIAYLSTLVFLMTRRHDARGRRLRTLLHFAEGVSAASHFQRVGVEHIHAHFVDRAATVALVAGRLLQIPYSVTAHANDIFRDAVLLREKLGLASFVVTVSSYNRSYLLRAVPQLAPSRIEVLHGWVTLEEWPPSERPRSDRFRIVSVGRLVEKKGHRHLVEACRLLVARGLEIDCRIMGAGPLYAALTEQIERAGLTERVRLLGGVDGETVRQELAGADAFVLACVIAADGDRDGLPVSLAEAMTTGLPVISTQLHGLEELVRPGTGLLVPPGDARALADAIARLAAMDPEDGAAMGLRGREVVASEFTVAPAAARLAILFDAARRRSGGASRGAIEDRAAFAAPRSGRP